MTTEPDPTIRRFRAAAASDHATRDLGTALDLLDRLITNSNRSRPGARADLDQIAALLLSVRTELRRASVSWAEISTDAVRQLRRERGVLDQAFRHFQV